MFPDRKLKKYLTQRLEKAMRELEGYDDFNGYKIEVHHIEANEFQLRAKPLEQGVTRYFKVKLTEMQ